MRALSLAAVFAALALGACTSVEYVNPCYGAGLLIPTDATADEVIGAANQCIADGGDRKQGLTIRSAGHLRGEQYDAAIADAEAAMAIDPNYPDAWYYRAFAHEEAGRAEQAERDFDKAIQLGLAPQYAMPARGRVKFLRNDFIGAYKDFDVWIAAEPENEEAYRLRGATEAVLERWAQAEADLSQAIALKPDDLKAYAARAYVKYFTKRYAAAAEDFKMSLSKIPEGLKAAFLYQAMRRAGDPEAEAELARQAAPLDWNSYPGVFPALYLGRVTIDQMISIAIATGKHTPHETSSEAFYYAGMAKLFAGDKAAAKIWFEKVLGTGVKRFDEIRGSRMELRDMGIAIPSPDPEARPGS